MVSIEQGLLYLGSDPSVRFDFARASSKQINGKRAVFELLEVIESWYVNGDEIIEFLEENIRIPRSAGAPDFYTHLWQTIMEAVQYLNEAYAESIQTVDQATDHILVISDSITDRLSSGFQDDRELKVRVLQGITALKTLFEEPGKEM